MQSLLAALLLLLLRLPSAELQASQLQRDQITCHYDSDCIENAYCKEQKFCLCKDDAFAYILNNGSAVCLQAATTLGDRCFLDAQCEINLNSEAVCDPLMGCQCRHGAHFIDGRCYHSSRAGETCRVRNDCHIDNPKVTLSCLYGICTCPQLYRPVNNGSDCMRTLHLGEFCDKDEECVTSGAVCKDVCHCTVHHEISQDGKRCLLAADSLESPCEEDAQCAKFLSFAKCQSGKCVCTEGFHYTSAKDKCWRNLGIGEQCSDSAECVVASRNEMAAECSSNGVCKCRSGFKPTSDNSDCSSAAAVIPAASLLVTALGLTLIFIR